jgi:cardiolipin synthase
LGWLRTGAQGLAAMLGAIGTAQQTVRLEMYLFRAGAPGDAFRSALVAAARRGTRVQVLLDAWGSHELPEDYWAPLMHAGGEFRWFNPLMFEQALFRDHRKLLVCDETAAFAGGFNIGPEYDGDGVASGWRDLGLQITGPIAAELAKSFDTMFARADQEHPRRMRWWRRQAATETRHLPEADLLVETPGLQDNPILHTLLKDLRHARQVEIATAYFLPTWRLNRALIGVARAGGRVRLLLPGKTDVAISQLASRTFYTSLLRAGVEIHEYQPQILHAKLIVVDGVAYVGSANLDQRGLRINYELMLRLPHAALAAEGRAIFEEMLQQSRFVRLEQWRQQWTFWERLKSRWARFLLARLDTYLARRQLRQLR